MVAKQGVEEAGRLAAEGWQRWQKFAETPEGREFVESVKQFAADLAKRGAGGMVDFRANDLPVLKKKAARLRDRLIELGKTKEAEQFWKEFLDWSDPAGSK